MELFYSAELLPSFSQVFFFSNLFCGNSTTPPLGTESILLAYFISFAVCITLSNKHNALADIILNTKSRTKHSFRIVTVECGHRVLRVLGFRQDYKPRQQNTQSEEEK